MINTDDFYVALSDSVRRRILVLLLKEEEVCVCELVKVLRLTQPKVSRHLGVLREGGIVTVRRVGTWIFYRLSTNIPVWACKTIELIAQGETGNAVFSEDANRLKCRPIRYAEIDLSGRKEICRPCKGDNFPKEEIPA